MAKLKPKGTRGRKRDKFSDSTSAKKGDTGEICFQLFFTTSPYCIVPSFALRWKMHYGESRLTCTYNIISIQKNYRSVKEIQLYSRYSKRT